MISLPPLSIPYVIDPGQLQAQLENQVRPCDFSLPFANAMKADPISIAHFQMRRRMLGTALCGALSACGGSAAVAPSLSGRDGSVSEMQIRTALSGLDALGQDMMSRTGIPGMAVAVVQGNRTVFAQGYGVASVISQQPVNADTVFQLASVSKSVGATVVATQVSKGIVRWDTLMSSVLPWFSLSDASVTGQLTIGDLYAHRSGLPSQAGDELELIGYERTTILERLRYLALDKFRTSYHYSNFGLTAAAEGVATAAAVDWATLSERAIYERLGMTRTSSRYADFAARTNTAAGHVLVDGKYVPGPGRDPDAQSPAGGISSSVNDMARWMAMVLGNGTINGNIVIAPDALAPALSPQILSRPAAGMFPESHYGFGFNVGTTDSGRVTYNHSGAFTTGASTYFMIVPSMNLAFIALTNAGPIGAPEALGYQFFDLVQYGEIQQDWLTVIGSQFAPLTQPQGELAGQTPPTSPTPAQPLGNYAGAYANDYFGTLNVSVQSNTLVLTIGPDSTTYTCAHWSGDVFYFTLPPDLVPAGSRFKVSFSGQQVTLEFFNAVSEGTFTRVA
jgi:CubicO group peptidase (beta-lactamase class C family)